VKLTPREQDRLTIFTMAELARRRRGRGIKLNHPEAVALICDEILEEARAGRPYTEVLELAGRVLERSEVMEGIPEMIPFIQIDALFPDGSKLVTVHQPIR
jgi:urease gamma subunit